MIFDSRDAHYQKRIQLANVHTERAAAAVWWWEVVSYRGGDFRRSQTVAIAEQAAQHESVEHVDVVCGHLF